MRALYSVGRLPVLVSFARAMEARLGWAPVYWLTQPDLHDLVGDAFPDAHRHPFTDANRGLAAEGLEHLMTAPLDADDLERAGLFEAFVLEIIDRHVLADAIAYGQRRALYHKLLAYSLAIIDMHGIGLYILNSTPHSVIDACLYAACQIRGVAVRMLHLTGFGGRQVVLHEIDAPPAGLQELYERMGERADIERALSDEGAAEIEAMSDPREPWDPWYVERVNAIDKKLAHIYEAAELVLDQGLASWEGVSCTRLVEVPEGALRGRKLGIPSETAGMVNIFRRRFLEKHDRPMGRSFARPGVALDGPPITWREYYTYRDWTMLKKTALRRHYESLTVGLDIEAVMREPFVYFPLHYQPERTTCPEGGRFSDQFLAAALLAHALPRGWRLLIKEHPSQFLWQTEGELGRWDGYYERFLRLPHVTFVPLDAVSKKLIHHTKAVATITGMAGWEGLLQGRSVLVFGAAWYQLCEGVFRISTLNQARTALQAVDAGFVPRRWAVEAFAAAIESYGRLCFMNPSHGPLYPGLSDNDNCAALVDLFSQTENALKRRSFTGETA